MLVLVLLGGVIRPVWPQSEYGVMSYANYDDKRRRLTPNVQL